MCKLVCSVQTQWSTSQESGVAVSRMLVSYLAPEKDFKRNLRGCGTSSKNIATPSITLYMSPKWNSPPPITTPRSIPFTCGRRRLRPNSSFLFSSENYTFTLDIITSSKYGSRLLFSYQSHIFTIFVVNIFFTHTHTHETVQH